MSKYLGTTKCIKCSKEAKFHCGNVTGKDIGALGIPFDVKVLAGFCSEECHNSLESDPDGCYGSFNYYKHGKVKDCYEEMFGKSEVEHEENKTKICDICNIKITEKEFKNNNGYCHKCFTEIHKR